MPQKVNTGGFALKHWEGDLVRNDPMTEQDGSYFNLDLGDFALNFPKRPNTPGIDPLPEALIGDVIWDFETETFFAFDGEDWVPLDIAAAFDPMDPDPNLILIINAAIAAFFGDSGTEIPDGLLRFQPGTTLLEQGDGGVWATVVFPTDDPGGGEIWLSDE